MNQSTIEKERVRFLNDREKQNGDYVLYWMQQSQRAECNPALEFAIQQANELDQPLLVVFGLMDDYPDANFRHCYFMLQGLRETKESLAGRGIRMIVEHGNPPGVTLERGKQASIIVCDKGYLGYQRQWREFVARQAGCKVIEIEGDVIVIYLIKFKFK